MQADTGADASRHGCPHLEPLRTNVEHRHAMPDDDFPLQKHVADGEVATLEAARIGPAVATRSRPSGIAAGRIRWENFFGEYRLAPVAAFPEQAHFGAAGGADDLAALLGTQDSHLRYFGYR